MTCGKRQTLAPLTHLLVLCALTLASCDRSPETLPAQPSRVQVRGGQPAPVDLDDLLRRVPPVSEERRWDPESSAWTTHPDYENLAAAANPAEFTDDQWRFVLAKTGIIQTRPRWCESAPLKVRLIAPHWLAPCTIEVTPRIPDGEAIRAANLSGCILHCGTGVPPADARRVVGRLTSETHAIEFQCKVTLHDADGTWLGPPLATWQGDISIPIEVVESASEAIDPVVDADLPRPMREIVQIAARRDSDGLKTGGLVRVFALLDRTQDPALEEVALGLAVDVLRDGVPAGSAQMPPNPLSLGEKRWCGSAASAIVVLDGRLDAISSAAWTLRVRGDAEMALMDLGCTKYWAGEFVVPLPHQIDWEQLQSTHSAGREP